MKSIAIELSDESTLKTFHRILNKSVLPILKSKGLISVDLVNMNSKTSLFFLKFSESLDLENEVLAGLITRQCHLSELQIDLGSLLIRDHVSIPLEA